MVQKFSPDGNYFKVIKGNGDGQSPLVQKDDVDSFGDIYVADGYKIQYPKFSPDGKFISKWDQRERVMDNSPGHAHGAAIDFLGLCM